LSETLREAGVVITLADGDRDLDGILSLQKENLALNLTADVVRSEGCGSSWSSRAASAGPKAVPPPPIGARRSGRSSAVKLTRR